MWKTSVTLLVLSGLFLAGCSGDSDPGDTAPGATQDSATSSGPRTFSAAPQPTQARPQLPPVVDKSLAGVVPPASIRDYTQDTTALLGFGDESAAYVNADTRTLRDRLDLNIYTALERQPLQLLGLQSLPPDAIVQGNVVCLRDISAATDPSYTCIAQFRDGWVTLGSGGPAPEELAALTQEYVDSLPG